jgi:uncharacterized membrane protein (DUF373 family)
MSGEPDGADDPSAPDAAGEPATPDAADGAAAADAGGDPADAATTGGGMPASATGRDARSRTEQFTDATETFLRYVEVAAAGVFALLFAIGVIDLSLQIVEAVLNGEITDPLVVIGFIDTGLLLLIIVEVYQTVVAYTRESDTRRIVRLVIYTGVIAMVRKVIVFRTGEYPTTDDALVAAVAYAVIILALVGLLYAENLVSRPESEEGAV